jgi:hypothetical protein
MKTDAVLNELPLTSRNLVILFSVRVRPHDVITVLPKKAENRIRDVVGLYKTRMENTRSPQEVSVQR